MRFELNNSLIFISILLLGIIQGCGGGSSDKSTPSQDAPPAPAIDTPQTPPASPNNGSNEPDNSAPLLKLGNPKPKGEFVSGALNIQETPLRKYKLISTAGGYNKEVNVQTLNGYKVYFSGSGIVFNSSLMKKK